MKLKRHFIRIKVRRNLIILTAALGIGVVLCTMQSCKKDSSPAKQTLYDSLGGTTKVSDPANSGTMIEKGRLGLRSVVDSAIFVIAADPEINGFFQTLLAEVGSNNLTGFTALSKNLTDFFCVATGAKNFTYGGKNMHDAHDPATNSRMNGKADSGDFDAFVADVVTAAKKNGLSDQLIGQVGVVIYSVKPAVVQK
ncbi:group 1 truncated hemoglobin [Flavitalea sp. BT771]|uniref:group 1 truncated hemoglobin n=1 Tax=Flavitalea sp. BT771 TaxID=3063329 RepID=UPI0026E22260|nr:group 1 truncated hemoglobin [Flavitalea sp. BT771]MDO6431207.1 group 1 truncated hemoglobin [Flavitalea sp. BT771]MDV6220114.1 group 1 truncated hemoglobin [Flavitalea sp. BT771]